MRQCLWSFCETTAIKRQASVIGELVMGLTTRWRTENAPGRYGLALSSKTAKKKSLRTFIRRQPQNYFCFENTRSSWIRFLLDALPVPVIPLVFIVARWMRARSAAREGCGRAESATSAITTGPARLRSLSPPRRCAQPRTAADSPHVRTNIQHVITTNLSLEPGYNTGCHNDAIRRRRRRWSWRKCWTARRARDRPGRPVAIGDFSYWDRLDDARA